ncbi:MAG: DUF1064 domain-containing protein [Desulfosalsimonadaceae bacterium]
MKPWTPAEVMAAKARMKGKAPGNNGNSRGRDLGGNIPAPGNETGLSVASAPVPSKYHNVLTECDGIRFQSKKEAKYYRELLCRVHAGEVRYFLRQVPMALRGGAKYVCDFVEFWTDGSVHYVEIKGFETAIWKLKKKIVEDQYPIRIEVVK